MPSLQRPPIDERTGSLMEAVLTGPVLLSRSPCVQPTDWQKCTAVDIKEFSLFYDTVVCPGIDRSGPFAALLSGGDYDGMGHVTQRARRLY